MLGKLRVRSPLKPLAETKRELLVTPTIDDLLDGRTEFGVFPQASCEILIGKYCAGYLVTVSRQFTKKRPDIEQVVGHDELWALCPRIPKPGWRILGRFYAQDCFIALQAWPKEGLFKNYATAAEAVSSDWKELFKVREPHRALSVEGYMSGVVRDVDQKP